MSTPDMEKKWKDLNITKDEVDRIGNALKDEKFRQMFAEYAQEISDPKNREIYEKEIAMMEAERGMDVQFIHPKPGHVLKMTAIISDIGDAKVFVNIAQNEHLAKPSSTTKPQPNGKLGMHWSIPHSFSPQREDADHKGDKCYVYDVVFHPDTYRMSSNQSFNTMLENTALEGLEKQFGLKIDRSTVKKMNNLKFKGRAEPTVMRKKKKDDGSGDDNSMNKPDGSDPLGSFPYPYENGLSSDELAERKAQEVREAQGKQDKEARDRAERKSQREAKLNNNNTETKTKNDGSIIPEYTITNQYDVDMADYSQTTSGTHMHSSHVPSALVVSIRLPELKSASQASLGVTERNLNLESSKPVKYNLDVKLSYPVDDENGSAKFDKSKKTLVVKLPVKRDAVLKLQSQTNGSSEWLDNGSGDSNHEAITEDKPFIEEISDTKTDKQVNSHKKKKTGEPRATETHFKRDPKVGYKCPDVSFEQEDELVTLVLNVGYVDSKSYLQKFTPGNNQVEVMFETLSSSGFPVPYYTSLTFPGKIDRISKNIAAQNVVMTIVKQTEGSWEIFSQFDSDGNEQVHTFLTQQHIKDELEQLEKLSQNNECKRTDLVVKCENVRPLTVDLQFTNGSQVFDKNLKSTQVVHNSQPGIHGILKNRNSTSDSSDELSHSHNSADSLTIQTPDSSPTDEQFSPRERKKSVSFSDRVEETKFKSQSTVCEMHKTLLNRRKKQRQRETRKETGEGRRRRNSSNSEYSSGDDTTPHKGGRRRRRNSSGESIGSESGSISPRDIVCDPLCSASCIHKQMKSEQPSIEELPDSEQHEQLNSDDDESGETTPKSALNWSDNAAERLIEKTKCAFDFDNSVMFDLD